MSVRISNSGAAFVSDPKASGLTFPDCLCFLHLQADRAVRGASRPAAAVGAAPAAVRAVHGPAALLPRHRAGGQLDEQTRGNVQAETSLPREQRSLFLFRLLLSWLIWARKSLPFQFSVRRRRGTLSQLLSPLPLFLPAVAVARPSGTVPVFQMRVMV